MENYVETFRNIFEKLPITAQSITRVEPLIEVLEGRKGQYIQATYTAQIPFGVKTIFKSLELVIRLEHSKGNSKILFYFSAGWKYEHPGGGNNGQQIAMGGVEADGLVVRVREGE